MKDRNRDRLGDGDERDVTNISETFKVEKKIRDEEEEMNKYIENELLKRRGIESVEKSNTFEVKKLSEILDPKSLYELPEVSAALKVDLKCVIGAPRCSKPVTLPVSKFV